MRIVPRLAIAVSLLCAACSTNAPAGESGAGALGPNHVLSGVPELRFDAPVSGHVGGAQIDAYGITLRAGDKIELDMSGEDDLDPSVTLFYGLTTKLSSASYEAGLQTILKRYTIATPGAHYLVVGAYRAEGEGDYTLTARCTGGPCAGEPGPVEPLDPSDVANCISGARVCSMSRMAADSSLPAQATFDACLAGIPGCTPACAEDGVEGATELCEHIVREVLPFYATHTGACREQFGSCMSDCEDAGGEGPFDLEDVTSAAEAMCLYSGYNGNCDTSYARELTVCGGEVELETNRACHLLCEATFGVWNDDLDTICVEECGEYEDQEP